ncbi:hypothetical protein F4782DRAFT_545306 [Xylaria castorea]|nr:hypothetical protein F4782DRAFT_545306 [Xylaria castorea]
MHPLSPTSQFTPQLRRDARPPLIMIASRECPATITITTQEDIHNASLAACTGAQGFNSVLVTTRGAASGLSFANFTGGLAISVTSSPGLRLLLFPDLVALGNLDVDSAPSLAQISLPKLAARAETLVYPVTHTLTPSISVSDAPRFDGLSLPALDELGDLVVAHVPRRRRQLTSGGLARIASARSIESDNHLEYPGLASVGGALRLIGYEDVRFFLPNLSSVGGDFVFTNAAGGRLQTASSLTVDGSFVLDTATYLRAENETTTFDLPPPSRDSVSANVIDVGNLTTVGVDATIRSNANARIDISGLTSVSGVLSISNNTNCTIDVTKLSQVGTLAVVDNVDSAIPQLFNLASAESIHLRGNIDTSSGPNILPSLTFVSGSVTIEPWNADFNCSRLVAQQQQGLINDLSCNGTSPSSSSVSSPSNAPSRPSLGASSQGLSKGAQVGIGVGVGLVVVLFLVGGATWLFPYLRRRFAALEASSQPSTPPPPLPPPSSPDTILTASNDTACAGDISSSSSSSSGDGGFGTGRETQVREADGSVAGVEKPAHVVEISHELYVPPAELPATHHPRGFVRR